MFANDEKYEMMKNMRLNKYIKRICIIFAIFFACLYIIEGIYLSFMLNTIINRSYTNLGLNNPYPNIVDDESFYVLCNRRGFVEKMFVKLPAYLDNSEWEQFVENNGIMFQRGSNKYLRWPMTQSIIVKPGFSEKYKKTIPFVFHWFIGGKAFYIYSYTLYENGKSVGGVRDIPVWITMDFRQSPWIVDAYEVLFM